MGGALAFEARYSIAKLSLWTLPCGIFVAAGVAMIRSGLAQGSIGIVLIGALANAFFGGALLGFLAGMVDRRVQIRIDGEGLMVRAHSEKPIALRSIRRMADLGRVIRILLAKPSKYPITGRFRRLVSKVNGSALREGYGDVWIIAGLYDCSKEAILEAIDRHRPTTAFERDVAERIAASRQTLEGEPG